jgi:hypothetical protein
MLWLLLSAGMMIGATTGYQATSAEDAEVDYNATADEWIVGNNTINIHTEPDNQSLEGYEDREMNSSIELSDTGEKYLNTTDEPVIEDETVEEVLPKEIANPTERFGERYTNRTMDFMFNTAASSADISAELTYRYRDLLTWNQISLMILFITVAPPVAFLYAAIKQV